MLLPHVALVLPYLGPRLPSYVGYVCVSMGSSRRATLLLFVEAETWVPWPCEEQFNVRVNRVNMAQLFQSRLGVDFGSVFALAPSTLAEFKPAWGHVFGEFLLDTFTHWTYTDTDVVFGDLDAYLNFDDADVETWAYDGDAGRLFLRGQMALQRVVGSSKPPLLWQKCRHLTDRLEENLNYKIQFFRERRSKKAERQQREVAASSKTFGGCSPASMSFFNSAEACFSCVVFDQARKPNGNFTVRVVPNLLTDHSSEPVEWRRSTLRRRRRTRRNNNNREEPTTLGRGDDDDDDDDDGTTTRRRLSSSQVVVGPDLLFWSNK